MLQNISKAKELKKDFLKSLKAKELNAKEIMEFMKKVSSLFINHYKQSGEILFDLIDIMADIIFHKNKEIAIPATEIFYGKIILLFLGYFNPDYKKDYYTIGARLIAKIRNKTPELDSWLNQLNIANKDTESKIFEWVGKIHKQRDFTSYTKRNKIKKIFILSRTTIGADIVFSSILLQASLKLFPHSEIIFVDSSGLASELFGGLTSVHFFIKKYLRKGTARGRFLYSVELANFIFKETNHLMESEFLVIDADTRLSQVGTIPLTRSSNSYLFLSTELENKEDKRKNGEVMNDHLKKVFGLSQVIYPKLFIKKEYLTQVIGIWKKFNLDNKDSVFIHYGVGGDNGRELSIDFEIQLIESLINKRKTIILAKPPFKKEETKNNQILDFLKQRGYKIVEIYQDENTFNFYKIIEKADGKKEKIPINKEKLGTADIYTFTGEIGTMCSIINKSSLYIGYNSQGMHVASTIGTPCIAIFNGSLFPSYSYRWTPHTKNFIQIIEANKFRNEKDIIFKILNTLKNLPSF